MDDKNNPWVIVAIVITLIIVGVGGYFLLLEDDKVEIVRVDEKVGENKINVPIEEPKVVGLGEVTNVDLKKLPKEIKYAGKIKNAVKFEDGLGENIVLATEIGGDENAELYAYRFVRKGDIYEKAWRVYDFTKDCPFALEASFLKNTFQVGDLDKDGVAEVWLMYKTACRSDVSPATMKIIMYEGQQKFAMRGENRVQDSDSTFFGGKYTYDQAFADGPKVFLEFAKKLWNENIMETWGNDVQQADKTPVADFFQVGNLQMTLPNGSFLAKELSNDMFGTKAEIKTPNGSITLIFRGLSSVEIENPMSVDEVYAIDGGKLLIGDFGNYVIFDDKGYSISSSLFGDVDLLNPELIELEKSSKWVD